MSERCLLKIKDEHGVCMMADLLQNYKLIKASFIRVQFSILVTKTCNFITPANTDDMRVPVDLV